jgi:hypothetical protein
MTAPKNRKKREGRKKGRKERLSGKVFYQSSSSFLKSL